MNIAFIPAKATSARLPFKNWLPWESPYNLATWAAQRAVDAGCFAHVVLVTDNQNPHNIHLPGEGRSKWRILYRPQYTLHPLSSDQAWLEWAYAVVQKDTPGLPSSVNIAIIRPTSPGFTTNHIRAAVEDLKTTPRATSIRSVRWLDTPLEKMWLLNKHSQNILPARLEDSCTDPSELFNLPSQSLTRLLGQTGAIEVFRANLLEHHLHSGDFILPYFANDPLADLDINTQEDYDRARAMQAERLCKDKADAEAPGV